MSYVKSVLQPGEQVLIQGKLHWIAYWHAIIYFVLGVVAVWLGHRFFQDRPSGDIVVYGTAIIFGALFAYAFIRAWFERWITEIAVTDRRIIYKRGFITRRTEEMNMDKVASVDVDQSILGRLLDYGTIHILGTGGAQVAEQGAHGAHGIEHLHRIAHPLAIRDAITAK